MRETILHFEAGVNEAVIGQQEVVRQVLIALLADGHVLLESLPGLAKTRTVKAIAARLAATMRRIQFTPDLLPSDITGGETLLQSGSERMLTFQPGPIFGNLILADEINRAPAKVQSALLEAMEERQISVAGKTHPMADLFLVMATQNPIEQEGTYPLPEAQLDRFMFNITVDYPTADEEIQIMKQVTGTYQADLQVALTGEDIQRLQNIVRRVPVADHVYQYARDLSRATRPAQNEAPDFVNELVHWGAGPRASIYLILAAKARAILHGRYHATTEDVREMALPVLRHRIITTFNAEAAGITSDEVVLRLLSEIRASAE
jgi:MoxR-like ATPase